MVSKFSLVMATYGRYEEVDSFLKSIEESKYNLNYVQVIIVDQNEKISLDEIIDKYKAKFNIIHIKSKEKGLSLNRSIGLKQVTGDIVAFPDDDCEYLPETLVNVDTYIKEKNCDAVMGRIVKRDGSDSLRTWPKKVIKVNTSNFYTKCSSVTIFLKKDKCRIKFNPKLGAGMYFGACEDADLIYKNIKLKNNIIYNPDIRIYHPHYESGKNMDDEKVYRYGVGFGAFVKSNLDVNTALLFIKAEVYHLARALIHLCTFNTKDAKKRFAAFKSRIEGFVKYEE
ncbi:glycosyltransferase [Clostridium algidicarnis]|uniref:glycosyltransferase family 2 protein n=1 Tax=Clostridium algidicarnis TaxID=37659 RepID=UPI001629FA0B|nr:glycosyltransferase family 2 protein [Clostridium algidicarnis]MBB6631489.1 glycosyltransferase family 2 protein [Clostridium algidicarnis]MCB2286371.1 glycosyltransferase [Clostridium algidicarnis]